VRAPVATEVLRREEGGDGEPDLGLTRGREAVRRPGDGEWQWRLNVLSGDVLRCGRGGEGVSDGWCEVRHSRRHLL
jgi:hypothetical protein